MHNFLVKNTKIFLNDTILNITLVYSKLVQRVIQIKKTLTNTIKKTITNKVKENLFLKNKEKNLPATSSSVSQQGKE